MDTLQAHKRLEDISKPNHKRYRLHGSPRRMSRIKAKLPKTKLRNKKSREIGVYATSVVVIAILYALAKKEYKWKYIHGKGICIKTRDTSLKLRSMGYVHICRSGGFDRGILTSLSKKDVRVIRTFRVDRQCLIEASRGIDIHLLREC